MAAQPVGEQRQAILAPRDEVTAPKRRNAPQSDDREVGRVRLRPFRRVRILERGSGVVPGKPGALDDVLQIHVLARIACLGPDAAHHRARERKQGAAIVRELADRDGTLIAFAATRADRERSGDPRPSLEERYPTQDAYLARVTDVVATLRRDRLLLDEDP